MFSKPKENASRPPIHIERSSYEMNFSKRKSKRRHLI